ncbi:hypothetical protein QTP88_019890 [Uroleucon formosanum]
MPQSPNQAKSNGNDKNTIMKKKTIIQDARLNKSTNISDLNPPPLQTNSNSSNNDDWKRQIGKRNHSSSSEPNSPTNIQKTTKNKKIFTSRNRFEVLSQTESIEVDTIAFNPTSETNDPESNPQQEKITHLPPPIMVKGVLDFSNYSLPPRGRSRLSHLSNARTQSLPYSNQLHPTTNTAKIRTALEEIGYQVRQITNVLHKHTKINLPIFFVDLEPSELNKDIFHVNHILHTKVKIEEPYKRRDIVQCLNCQEYGHTKTYCAHTPRCVRCAEHHPTSTCQKPRNLPAKCALCQGEHPANYKGCQIHKELQKLRNPNSRSNQPTSINNQFNPKTTAKAPSAESNPSSSHNRTYANVTSNQEPPKSNSDQPDPGKSPGHDLITAEIARKLPDKAIIHLTHIFNDILRISHFPIQWKLATIILFPKPNKPIDNPSSYRPISLLPFFSKLFEKLILTRIYPIIKEKKLIPDTQFGFREHHSTIHQIHRLADTIACSLEKKLYTSAVFLDISQAFDKVWHPGLLFKLKTFLPPSYYLFFKSYLSERHFLVRSGTEHSSISPILAGVPQGAVASPTLFNLYSADQPTNPNTQIAEYADDKVIFSSHTDPQWDETRF